MKGQHVQHQSVCKRGVGGLRGVLGGKGEAMGLPITALASTEGYSIWEEHVRPSRWTQGGSARPWGCVNAGPESAVELGSTFRLHN